MSEPISDEQIQAIREGTDGRMHSVQRDDLLLAIEQRDTQLATAWADLRERDIEIASLKRQLDKNEDCINEQHSKMLGLVGTLAGAIHRKEDIESENAQLKADLRERQSSVTELSRLLEQRDATIAELRSALKQQQSTAIADQETLRNNLREQTEKRIELQREIAELRKPAAVEPNKYVDAVRCTFLKGPATHSEIEGLLSAYDRSQQDLARTVNAWQVAQMMHRQAEGQLNEYLSKTVAAERRVRQLEEWLAVHKQYCDMAKHCSPALAQSQATVSANDAAREVAEVLFRFREHVDRFASQWRDGGGSHHHPIWLQVATALEPYCDPSGGNVAQPQAEQKYPHPEEDASHPFWDFWDKESGNG